jgi:type I restriction enzyme R subunit
MAEVSQVAEAKGEYVVSDSVVNEIKATTQTLVNTFDEATQIVDFFSKLEEVKRMKKEIKRTILDQSFGEKSLVKVVQERFMELGKTKFSGSNKGAGH